MSFHAPIRPIRPIRLIRLIWLIQSGLRAANEVAVLGADADGLALSKILRYLDDDAIGQRGRLHSGGSAGPFHRSFAAAA